MQVDLLTVPKKKVEEEFEALKQILKQSKRAKQDEIYRDYQKVYGHLSHGKKIIDVYEAFKKAGLNEDGDPKLAIVRADSKVVLCTRDRNGSAGYWHDRETGSTNRYWYWHGDQYDIHLPAGTFEWQKDERGYLKTDRIQTIVPVIPAKILVKEVKVLLKNFHIIWEVEKWKPVPPRDPILVKRLTPNLFGVLATWNLTELERAIIRGRIQIGET